MGHTSATVWATSDTFIAGVSPAMVTLESVMAEIAATSLPVLLLGEIGTGKEVFARRIHQLSSNGRGDLVRVSCASTTAEGLIADLGLNGGPKATKSQEVTVIFDEIGELDAVCQRQLVCALPDDQGALIRGRLSARVISTSSRSLEDDVRNGNFRRDLYYRVNGVCLRLPPLRERQEDIPLLAEAFLMKHAVQFGKTKPSLSAQTLEAFLNYTWPGNIRELENVVRKIVALNDELLATSELCRNSFDLRKAKPAETNYSLKAAARAASREAERGLILEALARTRWNRKRAAEQLQISYKSLLYKLKQIGVEESETRTEESRRRT